jgi:hypothetical protein
LNQSFGSIDMSRADLYQAMASSELEMEQRVVVTHPGQNQRA